MQGEVKERRDEKMLDSLLGDGDGASPIALAVIAIAIAVLMFGGCVSGGGCDDCSFDRAAQAAK